MLFLLACCLNTHLPDRQLTYTILLNRQRAGQEVDTYHADGSVQCTYSFNDRGRGPNVTARYVFNSERLPGKVDITGMNYYKANVDEHFQLENGLSKWDSKQEHGQGATGFYISDDGPNLFENASLIKCLLQTRDHEMAILPAGTAKLEKVTSTMVTSHGKTMNLTEYAISGLSYTPSELWVDENNDYFGVPGAWGATLREGWEDCNDKLLKIQEHYDSLRLKQRAKELAQHPNRPIAIEHVRVFDSPSASIRDDQNVVIQSEHILAVGASNTTPTPKGALVIDGSGKTLMPGLFDVHVHTGADDGIFDIMCGVTSVRDMGNDIRTLAQAENDWNRGVIIGPRLWKAGLIDGRGQYQCPTGLYADTLDEALADVRRYRKAGYIQIKLYSSLNPQFVPEIAKLSHQLGMRVSGHVPNGLLASQFVQEGADEIQHMNFIMLNFLGDKNLDTRTTQRFVGVGQYAGDIDLDSRAVADFIDLLLQHQTTVDITLAAFESMYVARPGQPSPDMVALWDRLPVMIRRSTLSGGLPAEGEVAAKYDRCFDKFLAMTKKLYDAGVPILAGTDGGPGFDLHRELELEVKAGIPPAKALQIATWNAARVLKQEQKLGSIEKGKLADLYLVEGDPTQNISDIRRSRLTFKGGTMYDCDALNSSLGVAPAK